MTFTVTKELVANEISAALMYSDFARMKNEAEVSYSYESNADVHQRVAAVLIRGPRGSYMMKYAVKDLLVEGFQGPEPVDFFDSNYDNYVWGQEVTSMSNDMNLIVRRLTETGLIGAIISGWTAFEV